MLCTRSPLASHSKYHGVKTPVHPHPQKSPLVNINLFSNAVSFFFFFCSANEVICILYFRFHMKVMFVFHFPTWHSMSTSRSIHGDRNGVISFFLQAEWQPIVYRDHIFCMQLCCHHLKMFWSFPLNIYEELFKWRLRSWGIYPLSSMPS